MSAVFRSFSNGPLTHRLPGSQVMLAVLAALLITAVACGTDRANGGNGVAASSFQVSGETLTWAPSWEKGDARSVTVTSSFELNEAAQNFLAAIEARGSEAPQIPGEQSSNLGVVSIIATGSNGATGEFTVSIEDLMSQLESQALEQPGFGDADLSQFTSMLGLAEQLDLGIEFGIDNNGSITGVTNLGELAKTVNDFADSMLRLAAFAGEEFISPEELQKLKTVLEELPKTEAAKIGVDSGLNLATANLFLMRSGEYTLGQPVVVSGKTPTAFGLTTEGTLSYELTAISSDTATVKVVVSPGEIDLLALVERLATELAGIVGEDADEITAGLAALEPDERSLATAVAGIVFEPYTVTLTIDAETGWVTAADWSVELALPEGFEDLVPEEERDFAELNITDLAVTVHASATFDEAVINNQ